MSAVWDFHKLSEKDKKTKQKSFEVLLVVGSLRGASAPTLMIPADYLRRLTCFTKCF